MIDMNTQNEVMLRAEYEDQSVHKLPLEMLGLQAVEGRPDILVLRLRPQGGKGDYLYVLPRHRFVEWMQNQIDELEASGA